MKFTNQTLPIHTKINQSPHVLSFESADIGIFYLPQNQQISGDSYIINETERGITVLLQDMMGHGKVANNRVRAIEDSLHTLANDFSISKEKTYAAFLQIEKDLSTTNTEGETTLSSISLVHLDCSNGMLYCLAGDSPIIIASQDKTITPEESGIRAGMFNLLPSDASLAKYLRIENRKVNSGDRVLVACDGMFDYLDDNTPNTRKQKINEIMLKNTNPSEIINKINEDAEKNLKGNSVCDDYTAICIYVK